MINLKIDLKQSTSIYEDIKPHTVLNRFNEYKNLSITEQIELIASIIKNTNIVGKELTSNDLISLLNMRMGLLAYNSSDGNIRTILEYVANYIKTRRLPDTTLVLELYDSYKNMLRYDCVIYDDSTKVSVTPVTSIDSNNLKPLVGMSIEDIVTITFMLTGLLGTMMLLSAIWNIVYHVD